MRKLRHHPSLAIGFCQQNQEGGLAAAGLLVDDISRTVRRYGGVSMTVKQIPDAASKSTGNKFNASC